MLKTQGVYIFQNSTYHYFRQVIPVDLRPAVQRTEFRVSLRTADRVIAKRKASCLSARIWDIFTALRKGDRRMTQLSAEQIQDLVKAWVNQELAEDEAARILSAKTDRKSLTPDETVIDEAGEAYDLCAADARESLATGAFSRVKDFADDILETNELAVDNASMEYKELCREILKGQIEICSILKQRNQGVYPVSYTDQQLNTSYAQKPNVSKKQQTKLSIAFKAYTNDKKAHGHWIPRTETSTRDKVKVLIEIMGDIRLCDITQEKLKAFEKALLRYPKNRTKVAKYRKCTIDEIMKMDIAPDECISITTVSNYLTQINGFLAWAKKIYELPDWLSTLMTAPKPDATKDKTTSKAVFTTEDISTIFYGKWYVLTPEERKQRESHKRLSPLDGSKFWLPLMALFSGARLEEMGQLYLADFKVIDDVKCFELTSEIEDEEGNVKHVKSLKNIASKRVVPIHDELLKLGLWEYVQELRDKGHSRLFEELNPTCADKKYTTLYSKWFNRHLKSDLKIKGNKRTGAKVFYSFRHTFINYCVQHGIDDRYFERVVGHALEGNPITYAHYAKALSPKILKAEVLDKVDYEIDLTCLRDNPFARTGQ